MPRFPAPAVRLTLVREASGTSRRLVTISNASDACQVLAPVLRDLMQERFVTLLLDARKRLICVATIAEGGTTSCMVDPKVLFAAALVGGAQSILVAHNHPSGASAPSGQDLALTRMLVSAGLLLTLPVIDHIIIGGDEFTSLRQDYPVLFEAHCPG